MLKLSEASLTWALGNATLHGDTDIFPKPFEYEAILHDWDNIKSFLLKTDVSEWTVRPLRSTLSPKSTLGFRVITQLDPLDFLIYAALVYEIAVDLEARRVPVSEQVVFSYRVRTTDSGQLFDPEIGYASFLSKSKELLDSDSAVKFVAVTDIADFYPRIYHHRLENSLMVATPKTEHVHSIQRLLSGWNVSETFGIPVGSEPSRLLAEATIANVDSALLARRIKYIRYNDDYRIFVQSYEEGYRHLAFLAEHLYRSLGLTLQPQKTKILSREEFVATYLGTHEDAELRSLRSKFSELVEELDLEDPYGPIEYDDLDEDQLAVLDSLNLEKIYEDSIAAKPEPDLASVRFVLRRLAQLGDASIRDKILSNLEKVHPVFPDIIRYFEGLRHLSDGERHQVGESVLDLIQSSIISESEFYRLWAIALFASSNKWGNPKRIPELVSLAHDQFSRRKAILAMGQAGQDYWFQAQWRSLESESPWCKRAFLVGASCLPADARKHWYRSIEPRLDVLERAVARWAKANPIRQ